MPAPVQEFGTYRDAFQEAARAGEILINKVAAFITQTTAPVHAERMRDCVRGERAFPHKFCPDVAVSGNEVNEAPSVQVRRLAYRTIGRYNALLADFAEGKAPDQLIDQARELLGLAENLAGLAPRAGFPSTGVPIVTAELNKILQRIAKERQAQAMRQAIVEGGPEVKKLLDLMRDDTVELYGYYLNLRGRESDQITDAIGDAHKAGPEKPE